MSEINIESSAQLLDTTSQTPRSLMPSFQEEGFPTKNYFFSYMGMASIVFHINIEICETFAVLFQEHTFLMFIELNEQAFKMLSS